MVTAHAFILDQLNIGTCNLIFCAVQDVMSQAGAAQHGQQLRVPGDRAFLLYDSYGLPLRDSITELKPVSSFTCRM